MKPPGGHPTRQPDPPEVFDAVAEERTLNQWTLGYFFDYLGHEVIYRQTPAGPEVLAVGEEEVIQLTRISHHCRTGFPTRPARQVVRDGLGNPSYEQRAANNSGEKCGLMKTWPLEEQLKLETWMP